MNYFQSRPLKLYSPQLASDFEQKKHLLKLFHGTTLTEEVRLY